MPKCLTSLCARQRKARASFIYALHTINDITGGSEEYQALIKSIFGLCSVFIVGQINKQTADDLPSFIDGITPLEAQSAVDFVVSETDKKKSGENFGIHSR